MITVLLWVVSAFAAVSVVGPDGCLTAEALDLETRATLGDDLVDRYDIVAVIGPEPEEAWAIRLEVSDGGTLLWRRTLHVVQADCPYVASLVGVSIERGLSKVPDLDIPGYDTPRHVTEGGFLLSLTFPEAERIGFGTYLSVGLPRPFRVEFALEGFVGLWEQVGIGRVRVNGGPLLSAGFAWEPRAIKKLPPVRLAARVGGGLLVIVGENFGPVDDGVELSPRGSVTLDAIFALGRQVRLGPRFEYAFARVRQIDEETGATLEEPAFRIGLMVAYAWPVVRH